jgi:hypothetical protein
MWPFRRSAKLPHKGPVGTKVVVEIPDALDPAAADRKYVHPLRQLLADNDAGVVVAVAQGEPNTADEFTRILTVEFSDLEVGLEILGEFLAENGAPAGTLTQVYGARGQIVDHFMLLP